MNSEIKVLAVCSGGGHLEQLLCIRPAFGEMTEVVLCTTVDISKEDNHEFNEVFSIPDCNRDNILNVIKCLISLIKLIFKLKPRVIITTGAAPGLLAVLVGRILRVKTIWIDSVANAEKMSMSGLIAGKLATLWLTQWPHLEKKKGPFYWGNVL